jgi:hypothetical protein
MVKRDDVNISQISNIVTASKVGGPFGFTGSETEKPIPRARIQGLARLISLDRIFFAAKPAIALGEGNSDRLGIVSLLPEFV